MGLQDAWIKQVLTQAKMNNMTLVGGTSAYLAGLAGVAKGSPVVAYDTGAGFVQWHIMIWDGVSSWVDASSLAHKHTSASDGGKYSDVRINNGKFWDPDLLTDFALWLTTVSGTGAAANQFDDGTYITRRYQTGTTSTGYATGRRGGIPISFALPIILQYTWQLSAVNNLYFNLGINMEDINVATNNNAKIGIEWCDGQATANYFMTTANGSARSSSDSTVPISTGVDGFKMIFTPAGQAQFKFDNGTIVNKTTNLPSTIPNANNILREGIKNNNGGIVNRDLKIMGVRLMGEEGLTEFVE